MLARDTRQWFKLLFGFEERVGSFAAYRETKARFALVGESQEYLVVPENGRKFTAGKFSCPSLAELRAQMAARSGNITMTMARATTTAIAVSAGESAPAVLAASGVADPAGVPLTRTPFSYVHEAITDLKQMHLDNVGATFQAASQFNALEFASPTYTPEMGLTCYCNDPTQGPACALACPAGTVVRNYFAPTANGQLGQSHDNQLNNLDLVADLLSSAQEAGAGEEAGPEREAFFKVENGYVDSSDEKLRRLNALLEAKFGTPQALDVLRAAVKIGLQEDTEVLLDGRQEEKGQGGAPGGENAQDRILVTQCYCSAISCGYSQVKDTDLWRPLACVVLEAAYEATILAAILNRARGGARDVFLTRLGGGVFRNRDDWISSAIGRALAMAAHSKSDLRVVICHYRRIDAQHKQEVDRAFSEELARLQAQGENGAV